MTDIEKRARELLAKAYRHTDYPTMVHESHSLMHARLDRRERAALDAIIAALTPPSRRPMATCWCRCSRLRAWNGPERL